MAKNVFSGFRSARLRPAESSRARRRVTTWAALGILALLATLLTPLSTASAQPSAPAAPTINAATPGDGTVTLSWTAGLDNGSTVIRWEYQQTTPATNLWIPIPGSNRHTTRHTITGLTNGTAYAFSLRAINGAGNGAAGDMSALTPATATPSTTPGAPVGLRAAEGNSQVALTWTAAVTTGGVAGGQNDGFSAITGYEIRQKTGDADYAPWAIIIGSDATTAAHTVTGLTNGVTYQFQIRARNANGGGAASETQPVTIATVPGRPRSLTATPGDGQVALSWVASSDGGSPILNWQFRLSTTGSAGFTSLTDPAWVTIPGSNADTTSYTVVSLDNAEEYTFQIRAVNAEGPGTLAESDEVNPGMTPGAPTGLQGVASENSVTITWAAPVVAGTTTLNDGGSPIIRYEYSQSTGGGEYGEWMAIPANMLFTTTSATDRTLTATAAVAATEAGTMGHTVRGLTAGTAYSFRVRALNATGPSEAASMRSPVYPGTKPPAPANLNASANYDAASGSASITLTWSSGGDGGSPITRWEYITNTDLAALSTAAGADATTWVAICDNSDGSAPSCAGTTTVTVPRADPDGAAGPAPPPDGTLTYVDRTTTPSAPALSQAEHHFVVRAVNARGNGFQSGTDSARFGATVPSAPPAVYIGATTATTITLTWPPSVDGGSAITRYEYSVKVGSGSYGAWVQDDLTPGVEYPVTEGTPAGTVHQFRVRAVNVRGAGSHTESPAIVPGAPGTPGATDLSTAGAPRLTATPGTTQVTLALTGTTGGVGTTTLWEYSYKIGDGEWGGWLYAGEDGQFDPTDINPSLTDGAIDGLENGVSHQFRIRATNPGGLHSPILVSNPATPGVAPPAPQGLTASAGDQSVTLSWTSGGSGGPAISAWHYCLLRVDPGTPTDTTDDTTQTCAATEDVGTGGWTAIPRSNADTTSHTITRTNPADPTTALVNGTSYTYLVRAKNAIPGNGARAQAAPATPGRAPSAPARALVDAGDGQVSIKVDPPSRNNGSAVVGYQVRKSENGGPYDAWEALGTSGRAPSAASAAGAVVSGLTNGVSYTFQVRAVNGFGPGPEIETASITPTGAPTANQLSADPGDGQVALSWNQLSSGGSTITKWQYRMSESGGGYGAWMDIADSGPSTTSHTVTGLDNGTSYSFEVRGVNVNLEQVNAEPITSASVTPGTVPAAPASVSAARGNGQVDVSWTAGSAPGAAATTGWQVQVDDGEWTDVDGGASASSHSVTGLMNGTEYTFSVRAVNVFGAGEAGSASATPATTPSAPDVSAMRGDGSTGVSWTAGDDGGSAVTGWQVQVNDGGWTDVAADTMSATVDTDDGTAYTIMVRGVNDVGEGASGSASVEAGSTPAAPTVTATGGNGSITVSWTAGDDGGSSINAWHYRMKVSIGDYGDWMEASADTMSVTLSDLGSGTGVLSYTFQVRGVNGVGEGAAGTSNEASPVAAPPANGMFYSGVVTGPDFCANMSLGGARLFAHDSDGDGVADVCSLPYTRREAIARQNAVEALSVQYGGEFARLVNAACAITEGDAACGGDMTAAPPAVPINDGGPFYSGIITGPSFCANRSLGGPTTYPHDGDGDGVADVCALPYTRREAIARQLAGDILAATYAADFARELASACRGLTGADYGDNPAHLAEDACA
ncbi:MAG: fibronectin type III domain-containing protein [bacterium]|nr:fibronectin type III domain-containing protein [bacterium]